MYDRVVIYHSRTRGAATLGRASSMSITKLAALYTEDNYGMIIPRTVKITALDRSKVGALTRYQ